MSSPTDDLAIFEEYVTVNHSLSSAPGSDLATQGTTGIEYSTDNDLPDLVDDESEWSMRLCSTSRKKSKKHERAFRCHPLEND